MSSILDALKKSEAERRNSPPGLNTPLTFAAAPPPRRRKPWLLPVVAIVALAVAWAGGLFDSGSSEPQDAEPTATSNPGEAGDSIPAPSPIADSVTRTGAAHIEVDLPPVPATSAQSNQGTGFGAREVTPETRLAMSRRPAPIASGQSSPTDQPPVVEPPARTTSSASAEPPAATASPDAATAQVQSAANPAPQPTPSIPDPAPKNDGVPSFNDLPFATRRALPALSMTMHLYSADPSRRLALINGVQARDGDELEGGIQIRAIRPDGVVIAHEGTEFLLPAHN